MGTTIRLSRRLQQHFSNHNFGLALNCAKSLHRRDIPKFNDVYGRYGPLYTPSDAYLGCANADEAEKKVADDLAQHEALVKLKAEEEAAAATPVEVAA